MFESARIKLTAWYCLIIMAISLAFSLTIYQMMNVELQRFARNQRFRLERKVEFKLPPPPVIDPEVLAETQQRIIVVLLGVNGIILVFSATLGYFLAGRTLSPIKKMVEEQKRFIDDASHEIRTPLTALKTNLEVNLRDPNLKLNEAKKVITESVEETNKLILLSNYLLNLSRLDQNKIKLQLETIKFNQFKSLFSKNQRIKFISSIVSFTADKSQIQELLTILVDNALKYSQKTVKVWAKTNSKNIIIHVKDYGIGIDQKEIPHIFERFYRVDSSRNKTVAGYGLGLSIARQIVDLHHGQIVVKSQLNRGTDFQVHLPIKN